MRICVFCASSLGRDPAFADAARRLGHSLARRGITAVYGGGRVGLMGLLAETVLAEGGEVIGVIPRHLLSKEVGHTGLTELRVVDDMHQRRRAMYDASDAFLALPGGIGTFEELAETLSWIHLGLIDKRCGILNVSRYFDPFLHTLKQAEEQGLLKPDYHHLLTVGEDLEPLLDELCAPPEAAAGANPQ